MTLRSIDNIVKVDLRGTEEEFREQVNNALNDLEERITQAREDGIRLGANLATTEWLFWERINGP